jgi:SAM-dependent methyltransferase
LRPEALTRDLLCCPACAGALRLAAARAADDGHVIEGTLSCGGCGVEYPVRGGIPRLMTGSRPAAVEATVGAFGYQWRRANDLLKDRRFSAPEVFLDFIHPVTPEWFRDKVVLDAGCGFGRFTIAAAGFGAAFVVGVDLSDAVDVAFENTRHLPNVLIVQADIQALPLRRRIDYAFSVGVLHHTSDPRGAFLGVLATVVPGGSISAWVYGREHNGWIIYGVNPLRRVTSRLPRPLLLAASFAAAIPLTLLTRGVYGPVSRRPWLRRPGRHLFYYEYFVFLSQFGWREHAFVIFDHAVPVIAHYVRGHEVGEWFAAAKLERVRITMRGGNSWRAFGVKPV